jgi:preprotein translocase subunit SecD
MEIKLNLTNGEHKDLVSYCNLNDVLISEVVKKSFTTGFNIERYGLLNSNSSQEKIVEKEVEKIVEVIKEVPVEKIVEVIKEVVVEKPVEKIVIKEVPVEKIVTKVEYISDDSKTNELFGKIEQLEFEKQEMANNFQSEMSKKQEELDKLRYSLDELLAKPPVEKIVEVVVEKEIMDDSLKPKLDALQTTLSKVRQETLDKDEKIKELERTIQELKKTQENRQAVYFRGSNLNNKL